MSSMNINEDNRIAVQSDFLLFCRSMFELDGKKWLYNWHQKSICDALEKVVIGKTKRLIINIPPRYSKTEISVVNFIAWSMGLFPDSEFIHASYSKRLATNNAYKARALMISESYQAAFPDIKLKGDSKAKDEFRTTQDGVVYATGAEGTITGYGAGKVRNGFGGAIIIDDPHKAGEALSETRRQNVIEWYQTTIESRCNNSETPIIVIMQRLHENDLSGWLLDGGSGEEWEHLCLPVISEQEEALWPEKHSIEKLRKMEKTDAYGFAGQYMQRPAPKGGGMFKKHWWQRYSEPPAEFIRIVQSWDTAQKAKDHNDPSVCTTWGETDKGYYLLHVHRERMEYPDLKRAAKSLAEGWNPDAILIEDKSSGSSLIQDLQNETVLPVIPIEPVGDKVTRASVATPIIESGRVFIPSVAAWLPDYESEFALFPNVKHDDQVDSSTQFLSWIRTAVEIFIGR